MRKSLLCALTIVTACASAPNEEATHEEATHEGIYGDYCSAPPVPCVGWPASGLVTPGDIFWINYCTAACGAYAYCPVYPDVDINYCAAHPHDNTLRCFAGLPNYPLHCQVGDIVAPPI